MIPTPCQVQHVWHGGFVVSLFDHLENVPTSVVTLRYPHQMAVENLQVSVFSGLKWSLLEILG